MDTNEIKIAILRYIAKRPNSQDSIEGIANWWLMREHIETNLKKIEAAVEGLVEEEILISRGKNSSSKIYSLNKDKMNNIMKLFDDKYK